LGWHISVGEGYKKWNKEISVRMREYKKEEGEVGITDRQKDSKYM